MFRGSVKGTGYRLHSPVSPSLPPPVRHRVPSYFNWSLPHYLINGRIFAKKIIEHKIWVLIFSTTFVLKYFSFRKGLTEIRQKNYIYLHEKYMTFLSDFNETWVFSIDFRKIFNFQILWKSVQWEPSCSMWTDRQADMAKVTVTFWNFRKELKNILSLYEKFRNAWISLPEHTIITHTIITHTNIGLTRQRNLTGKFFLPCFFVQTWEYLN